MRTIILQTGFDYMSIVNLGSIDRFATNEEVKVKFEGAGFIEVRSEGFDRSRSVRGKWAGPNQETEIPHQIIGMERII